MAEIPKLFVTLGMFIIDEFEFYNEDGEALSRNAMSQIGGGGTYAAIGARIWMSPNDFGCIIDRGPDFPSDIQSELDTYGESMWLFRDHEKRPTTRALNLYRGNHRDFKYLNERLRISPKDLSGTKLERPYALHFICSPSRALSIMREAQEIEDWQPIVIYEPIPDRCVPEELPSLKEVMPFVHILSPNAEEALNLLSMEIPKSPEKLKSSIELAGQKLLAFGLGDGRLSAVIIRSGELGAYVLAERQGGKWIPAFWETDSKVVDVTGAGNSFLGGLAAGLYVTADDPYEATYYGSVSASFVIEQQGLPRLKDDRWNDDVPIERLKDMKRRQY